ncbi:MAG: ATP-binding cassette domain-containing protein [Phycisphaeraceae bacterium]|nr:ATP-binding cassette domain-containing protein [Phycisphaeraceae bacterium]
MLDPQHPAPAVLASHLTIRRGDTLILDDLSCTIPRGSCTVILGPNGCGKTTLTRAMIGQTFLTEGTVVVLDHTLGQTDIRALRRRIGVVNPTTDSANAHQSGAVVDAELTALEAVLTGFFGTVGLYDVPTDEQRLRATELLARVGLQHRAGLRFTLLSTGEQRRCLIARALVHEPELLILDEPTAGLDVAAREQVLAVVHELLRRPNPPTVLFITHHVEEIPAQTAQVLLMKQGRILAAGRPQEVVTPESLSHVFGCKVYVRRLHKRYWLEVLPEAWLGLLPPTTP